MKSNISQFLTTKPKLVFNHHPMYFFWDRLKDFLADDPNHQYWINSTTYIKILLTCDTLTFKRPHDFYPYASLVYEMGAYLLSKKDENKLANELFYHYKHLLENRLACPLKISHHRLPDAYCSFSLTNAMLNDEDMSYSIDVVDCRNEASLSDVIFAIKEISLLGHGHTFAGLPLVNDSVIQSLLTANNTLCFVARNASNRIIGFCWGVLLADVKSMDENKNIYDCNVFWVCNMGRYPDYTSSESKVGQSIRDSLVDYLMGNLDCDFVGFKSQTEHRFHESYLNSIKNQKIKSSVSDDFQGQVQSAVVKNMNSTKPFPSFENMRSALINYTYENSNSTFIFLFGAASYYGSYYYYQVFNSNPSSSLPPFKKRSNEDKAKNCHASSASLMI